MQLVAVTLVMTVWRIGKLGIGAGRAFGVLDWMAGQRLLNVIISSQQQFIEQLVVHRLGSNYLRIDQQPSNVHVQKCVLEKQKLSY